jgi:hypothetical protein
MHDEERKLTNARWLRIKAAEWRVFAATVRDPFVREIFLGLVEVAEAEIATGSKSDLPTIS